MEKAYNITLVSVENDFLRLEVDGKLYNFKINEISERLSIASEKEKKDFRISPSGYGIHWNLIDEDISINGLMKKCH